MSAHLRQAWALRITAALPDLVFEYPRGDIITAHIPPSMTTAGEMVFGTLDAQTLYVASTFVQPQFRRKGIAEALLVEGHERKGKEVAMAGFASAGGARWGLAMSKKYPWARWEPTEWDVEAFPWIAKTVKSASQNPNVTITRFNDMGMLGRPIVGSEWNDRILHNFAIDLDGKQVGVAQVFAPDAEHPEAVIAWINVVEGYRRKGVATAAYKLLVDFYDAKVVYENLTDLGRKWWKSL